MQDLTERRGRAAKRTDIMAIKDIFTILDLYDPDMPAASRGGRSRAPARAAM